MLGQPKLLNDVMPTGHPTHHALVFVWDNFGPMHNDRCKAVADLSKRRVIGLELHKSSETYEWEPGRAEGFERQTLISGSDSVGRLSILFAMLRARRRIGKADWFLCHYERPEIFGFALILRLFGSRVFTMGCSKFDDRPRRAFREYVKSWWLKPYCGAIGSGNRSKSYLEFQGIPAKKILGEYNTLSITRMVSMSGTVPAPEGVPFDERDFTIVARLVPKKNLFMALESYSIHARSAQIRRRLNLCGSGVLEAELREKVRALGLGDDVIFHGFLQSDGVARILGRSLALLLPSVEEQFGNVVIEAQAMGVPVILSDACGARDLLVRNGVNGFVIEPDNPEGMAYFMGLIASDQALWRRMCAAALTFAPKGDVARFAEGVIALCGDQTEIRPA